ncbi:hypothetical protein [Candidatus Palauibacter scopulicola]|uniref:hypothetical protein n=2 Tax=Candidatus Palauibacter scopulicola TaxID=3056741 RepID=UPI0028776283|nr:hypothetical protein [Candidatus Palauibacter scopulicola]
MSGGREPRATVPSGPMIPSTAPPIRGTRRAPVRGKNVAHTLLLLGIVAAPAVHAQASPPAGGTGSTATTTIDTIVISRQDVFPEEAAAGNIIYRLGNGLHGTTQPWVIRRELLLGPGTPYDSLLAAESERNLRRLGLFRRVRVDSTRVDGRLALNVRTRDAWSLQPRFTGRLAADGTLTGTFGVTEINLAGSGNAMRVWYVRETDRDGMDLRLTSNRLASTRLAANATWLNLSDRDVLAWYLSSPFRALSDRSAFYYEGRDFRGRIPQYVRHNPDDLQTIEWRRRAQIHRLTGAIAPVANPREVFRIGATLEVRHEEHLRIEHPGVNLDSLDATVPDSVYGLIGVYAEWRRARFERVERFNGFSEEDQDLSDRVWVSFKLAHERLGYRSTGIGTRLLLSSGRRAGPAILKGALDGGGLFNSAGLDSGYVFGTGTAAVRETERNTTFLQASAGIQERPRPGSEHDIGFQVLPRLWGPHAFVGTRTMRATLEHRSYLVDNFYNLFGLGVGAFVDYGGAWYPDQDRRLGGNVGITVFGGSPLSSFAQVTNLNIGYRFGGGIGDSERSRWAFSAGGGLRF